MRHGLTLVSMLAALYVVPSRLMAETYTEATRSKPAAQNIVDTIPPPRDIPFPGILDLRVDASDTRQRIFRVTETIPVTQAGPLTLLYPQWLPGTHGPMGAIDKLAGLKITIDGKPQQWVRDPLNVFAFHLSVPNGT